MSERLRISVDGIVQGVGFRPFIYRLAKELVLSGWVTNTTDGVVIEVEGVKGNLEAFLSRLEKDAPPLSKIMSIQREYLKPSNYRDFIIRRSLAGADPTVLVAPDSATCPDCVRELFDPEDRRYRYPFINCTNCGPRYTILRSVPYDRPNTSMAKFPMCENCQGEYDDPADRRFHAQPNACADCGPTLTLVRRDGTTVRMEDPLQGSIELLKEGKILAIKGLGGFHLAVDALFSQAVEKLREKKGREEKPLALMVRDLETASLLCELSDHARSILTSTESPIALLRRRQSPDINISHAVAPRSLYYGLMLPYTPLHHLLMAQFDLLVMTSANLTEEPLCADNDEALQRLSQIADAFLIHDRDIVLRCDDSIVRLDPVNPDEGPIVLRRARGFVPSPVNLPMDGNPVLALGPELKGTVCLTRGRQAFMGQHLGDLKNLETLDFLKEVVSHLMDILEVTPLILVCDLHPDYLTTGITENDKDVPWPSNTPVIAVQHHHAHILSCQAEAGLTGPCVGIALDGTGYGTDGTIWGGEILHVDGTHMDRKGYLRPMWMPGGEKSIEQPWRMAVSCLLEILGAAETARVAQGLFPDIPEEDIQVITSLCVRRTHGVWTSSAGRLFDAVSALLGICTHTRYEGQAAIELEVLTDDIVTDILPYSLVETEGGSLEIDLMPAFESIFHKMQKGFSVPTLGGMFHTTMARALAEATDRVLEGFNGVHRSIPLGGGVFQNELFCSLIARELSERSMKPVFHKNVPTNDGGISLGQAVYGLLKSRDS
ncbi:MAG: carbamoyltransferase HypF [bacterium]|nr:carbamoyltransferase HypF [bacterium]MDT8366541.1 carbamoyltransferase HypF [bacterium]